MIQPSLLGCTNSNFGEYLQNFLCFFIFYFQLTIGLYLFERHQWRIKMFHITVYKAWNLFKRSDQLLEILQKFSFTSLDRSREESSIDRKLFSIDQTRQRLQDNFLQHFDRLTKSFNLSNILNFEFSFRKFQNLNFNFRNNILKIQISLLQPIHVYTYIYNIYHPTPIAFKLLKIWDIHTQHFHSS